MGWYIGFHCRATRFDHEGDAFECGHGYPYSRESDYYRTSDEARQALHLVRIGIKLAQHDFYEED
tara:strand:- start:321 stop:515 length:195 start_codon:yes stop_codon:yes gene_type:complete